MGAPHVSHYFKWEGIMMSKNLPDLDDLYELRKQYGFPPYCIAIWTYIRNRMNPKNKRCWTSEGEMADALGYSPRTIRNGIRISKDSKVFNVNRRNRDKYQRYQSNEYTFNLDKGERKKSMPFSKIRPPNLHQNEKSEARGAHGPEARGALSQRHVVPPNYQQQTNNRKTNKEKTASPSCAASSAVAVGTSKIAPEARGAPGSEYTEHELYGSLSDLMNEGYDSLDLVDKSDGLGLAREEAKKELIRELEEKGVKNIKKHIKEQGLAKMARYRPFLYDESVRNPAGLYITAIKENYLDEGTLQALAEKRR